MPDEPKGQDQVPEEKPTEPMPSSDKPAETPEPKEPALPDGASERTKEEFEKLKEHNRELAAKLAAYETQEPKVSVIDSLRPPPGPSAPVSPQPQGSNIPPGFVDTEGNVDIALLNRTLAEANERARRAEAEARRSREDISRFEENRTTQEVHKAYPQVDPNSKTFDPRFYELVRNEMIGQLMKGQQDFMEACKKVSDLYQPADTGKAKEEAVKEYKDTEAKKEQINATGGGGKGKAGPDPELVSKTHKGDRNALYERLQASGY